MVGPRMALHRAAVVDKAGNSRFQGANRVWSAGRMLLIASGPAQFVKS